MFQDVLMGISVLVYHLDNNLFIGRCKEVRTYKGVNGNIHKYFSDFITDAGIIEIKGYNSKNAKLKAKYNPDVINLYKCDMEKYLNYAVTKYWEKLYN